MGSFFRVGNALVVLEVALAFVLLAGSTLMVQTLAHLLRQNPGFRTENVLTFDLPQSSMPTPVLRPDDALVDQQTQQLQEISDLVRQLPGVTDVATADHGVLNGMRYVHSGLQLENVSDEALSDQHVLERYVSPAYFRILGVPLLRGRPFNERDARNATKVIIINESMARKFWGSLEVLGKHVNITINGKGSGWNEIVGVAADVRDLDIQSNAEPEFFLALSQWTVASYHLFVRSERDPDALAAVISRQIGARFPDQPMTHATTLRRTISESIGDQRLYTVLLGIFAAIGVSLALLGIYGIISYSVTRRTQEIGVRVALGARPADVLRMVIRQGLVLIAAGTVIGLTAALAMTRFIAGELYGVKPNDPATLLMAIVLILLVGGLACWTPARRAMRVDPMVALRYE